MKRTEVQVYQERLPTLILVKELYEGFALKPSLISSKLTRTYRHTPEERNTYNKAIRTKMACDRLFPGGQEEAVELCKQIETR